MSPRKTTKMTAQHKAALAEGRAQGRAIRDYLEVLEEHRPKRGRKRTPESIKKRLATIDAELPDAAPLTRLHLVQERLDLERELDALETKADLTQYEKAFVKVAKGYAQRKGVSHTAWRELGVPPDVLRRAGITRSM